MQTIQIDPSNARQRKLFLDLPFRIYKRIPQWVPPMASDASRMLNSHKHPFYKHGEAAFYLTFDESGSTIGRLAILNNFTYNEYNHDNTAFFYLFESIDDPNVVQNLFGEAALWVRDRHLKKISGAKGFTALDGMGVLVKGFEHRPAFGLPYNPPYYSNLLESVGFVTVGEVLSGFLDVDKFILPPKVIHVARLVQKKLGMKIVRLHNRRDLVTTIPILQKMYNDALGETTGNIPLTEDDVKTMASQLLWFADLRLIKLIMKDDQAVGFLLAYPDISAALQRCRGYLFPLGWIGLLLEMKRTQWVNINGAGIVEKFRGLGGTALLFSEMYQSVRDSGYKYADLVQIGTENERMQLELRNLGIDFYKIHRMYELHIE